MKIKSLFIIIICCLILTGCQTNTKEVSNSVVDGIVVDVRTREEYDTGHVVGAVNIPYDEIDKNVDLDKTQTIYVYCKSGKRSEIAYNKLKSLGYEVIDLGAYSTVTLEKE